MQKNAIFLQTKQFRATTCRKLCNWAFQRTHYWILKIKDVRDPLSWKSTSRRFFSAEGGPIWIKFRRLVQNDMSTAVMWSKSKPDVEFQYGGPLGESMACHPRATYHIAGCCHLVNSLSRFQSHIPHSGCKNSIRRIENRFSPYFIFFAFLMQFRLWRAAAFVSSPIHLFYFIKVNVFWNITAHSNITIT